MTTKIGEALKIARENQSLTQEEVSKKLYVTRQTVSRWEQNKTIPNIYVLKELSQLYELPLNDLISTTSEIDDRFNVVEMPQFTKKKVHLFSLIGVFIFNLYLLLAVSIISVCILLTGWFLAGVFSVSPIILATVNLMGLQVFTWHQLFLSLLLCLIGVASLFLLKKVTTLIYVWGKKYILFNYKSVWY